MVRRRYNTRKRIRDDRNNDVNKTIRKCHQSRSKKRIHGKDQAQQVTDWDGLEDYYIGVVGINPDSFWDNTWKQNYLLGEAYEIKQNKDWERIRYIAYSNLISSISINGKPNFKSIKKPTDIFTLPQDRKSVGNTVKIDKEQQAIAVERHKKMMAKIK